MSKLIVIFAVFLILSVSFAFNINNTSGTVVAKEDIAPLVADFESREGVIVEKVDIFFDEYALRYKIHAVIDEQKGMSHIMTPKTYLLDSDWNILEESMINKIGLRYVCLGIPGILVNTFFDMLGLI